MSRGADAEVTPRVTKSSIRHSLVAGEILDQAAALFAQRGFRGTSLQDIADTLDVSRAALYHYFSSKEDLLAQLVHGITRSIADRLFEIRRSDLDPPAKVAAGFREIAHRAAVSPARFVLLDRVDGELPEALVKEHVAARREVVEHFTAMVREGVEAGRFRSLDPALAAHGLLGMSTWVAWWYRPHLGFTPEEVADGLTGMALQSLMDKSAGGPSGLEVAISSMRDNLSYIEKAVQRLDQAPPETRGTAPTPEPSKRSRRTR